MKRESERVNVRVSPDCDTRSPLLLLLLRAQAHHERGILLALGRALDQEGEGAEGDPLGPCWCGTPSRACLCQSRVEARGRERRGRGARGGGWRQVERFQVFG